MCLTSPSACVAASFMGIEQDKRETRGQAWSSTREIHWPDSQLDPEVLWQVNQSFLTLNNFNLLCAITHQQWENWCSESTFPEDWACRLVPCNNSGEICLWVDNTTVLYISSHLDFLPFLSTDMFDLMSSGRDQISFSNLKIIVQDLLQVMMNDIVNVHATYTWLPVSYV